MDDSSLFMQWAMNTLQHQHPPAVSAYADGGDTFPSLQTLRNTASQNGMAPTETAAQDGHRATDSCSPGDTDSGGGKTSTPAAVMEHDGWSPSPNSVKCAPSSSSGSTNYRPVSWNFTSALAQPSNETTPNPGTTSTRAHDGGGVSELAYGSPPSRRASAKSAASTGHTSTAPYAQDHTMAERRRREKINQRFIELSTVIPGLKKMDKATILSDAVRYLKELQEKLRALEDHNGRSVESVVLVKKPCIAAPEDDDGCPTSSSAAAAPGSAAGTAGTTRNALPEIEARISESNVMVRIHCDNAKGVLVRLLAEVEGLHLRITHTNALPFPACTVIITIVAKVEEGFNVTAEDIVGRLNSALHQHSRNNTRDETKSR